ncbi:MAG: hypothetical protein WCI74_08080, partial [Actinomycetes bacterium]
QGESPTPARIGVGVDWVAATAGGYHGLAVSRDGRLWGWGWNEHGQVGDGAAVNRLSPTPVGVATDWRAISSGSEHSLALKSDGSLWAWGSNELGQVGDGTTTNRSAPVRIGAGGDWGAVSAGGYHSLATRTDGSLWAWGWNGYGRLGDGTMTQRVVPFRLTMVKMPVTVSVPKVTGKVKRGATLTVAGKLSHPYEPGSQSIRVRIGYLKPGAKRWKQYGAERSATVTNSGSGASYSYRFKLPRRAGRWTFKAYATEDYSHVPVVSASEIWKSKYSSRIVRVK